jgi:hypothetical protein
MNRPTPPPVFGSTAFQTALLVVLALLIGNVNALVDSVLHPEIPYFDREHIIVGGFTALVSVALSFLLLRYARRLNRAADTIDRLQALLPICSNCKKIRKSGADAYVADSWQAIESYITEKTRTEFSHGVCPECREKLYPEYVRKVQNEQHRDT